MPIPQNRKEIQSFLGLVNYYRRFLPNFSKVEAPLRDIVNMNKYEWTKEADVAYSVIKRLIERNI